MKISIREIGSNGLEAIDQFSQASIGFTGQDDLKLILPIDVKARIERAGNTVLANIHVSSKYSATCGRCLEMVEEYWRKDFLFDFPVERHTEFIELDEDIRQEILLNLPTKVLCQKDCKGLCPGCGVNLNKEECRCKNI